jgi:outer membrane protein
MQSLKANAGRLASIFIAVGLLMTTASTAFAQSDSLKIGYVDLHAALNQVDEGKKAKKKLKKEFKKKQQRLNKKQKEVKKLRNSLKKESMMLSKKAKRKKSMKLKRKMSQLQKLYMEMQQNISKKEAKATKPIFDKMRKVIDKIAQEKGYDLVLEKRKSSVLFAKDAMNLTDELVKRYEKQK